MKMDMSNTGKKYNYPKEVKLTSKAKVDAVGIQSQFKDIESLKDDLRKLQKAKREEVENAKSLKETLRDYDHQRIKLEAQVTQSNTYRSLKKRRIYLDTQGIQNMKMF